jgi:hypothetical protein
VKTTILSIKMNLIDELKKENERLKTERAELLAKHTDLLAENTRLKSRGKKTTFVSFNNPELISDNGTLPPPPDPNDKEVILLPDPSGSTLPPPQKYLDPNDKEVILLPGAPIGSQPVPEKKPWTGYVTIHHKNGNPIFQ